jgi:hypothetical protein
MLSKVIGVFFAIACFATAAMSNSMMGTGFWFWAIIGTGFIVAVSQFYPKLSHAGSGLALLLSLVSVFAVALGLLAGTIGGSFKMDDNSAFLLFLFSLIAILGLAVGILNKQSSRSDTK